MIFGFAAEHLLPETRDGVPVKNGVAYVERSTLDECYKIARKIAPGLFDDSDPQPQPEKPRPQNGSGGYKKPLTDNRYGVTDAMRSSPPFRFGIEHPFIKQTPELMALYNGRKKKQHA